MRFQDENTVPREPTLAERRARQQAARREREEAAAKYAAEEKSKKRKRILIGAGVTVGVVALIAVGYSAANDEETVEARCVDEQTGVVADDSNCVQPASGSTYHSGGGFYPIFIGTGGRQYHYNYGGSGSVGQVAAGGTTVAPKNARVSTPSGKTISRGGLGVSSGSSSSGS
ncbi:hypothetical protein [Pseudonocardia sp. H11422]|uniref:hypothetical protein n=1 Tax=Pseudonocardia sp. H11422 TaxID=2835866 RepID=UPI001BDD664B|nr:hypothetical protein [Pseudonocardia sp. H11422]